MVVCTGLGTELETSNDCVRELLLYVKPRNDKIEAFYCRVLYRLYVISVFLSHQCQYNTVNVYECRRLIFADQLDQAMCL